MERIHEHIFENETVFLDDKHWSACSFKNCTLVLNKGTGSITNCIFDGCKLTVAPGSPALSVLQIYEMFNKGSIKFN